MSDLKLTPDAIAAAVAVIADAARKDEASVKALLVDVGFEIAGFQPPQEPHTAASVPGTIGQLVDGRGVHLGEWSFDRKYDPVEIYSAPDFLRDRSGNQLILSVHEAVTELTSRNDGRRYGNGAEAALRQALREGRYQEGDLVLAPREILNGRNAWGEHIRPDNNVCDLLRTSPAFTKLLDAVNSSSGDGRWTVSGSEQPELSSIVLHVRLTHGFDDWYTKFTDHSGVVPARIFKRATSQHVPAG